MPDVGLLILSGGAVFLVASASTWWLTGLTRIVWWRLGLAGLISGFASVAAVALSTRTAGHGQGLWLAIVIMGVVGPAVAALIGLRRWADPRTRVDVASWIMLIGVGGMAIVSWWATIVEPRMLVVERETLRVGAGDGSLRVVVLADVQTSRVTGHEHRTLARVRALEPDLIVMPGDLYQRPRHTEAGEPAINPEAADQIRWLMSGYAATAPTVFTPGNKEARYDWQGLLRGTGVVVLESVEPRVLEVAGVRLVVAGVGYTLASEGEGFELAARMRAARATSGAAAGIVLAHTPDAALALPRGERSIDALICGHTHGGQVALPWYGPILNITRMPRDVAGGGMHEVRGNRVYVSRGVGWERAGAPPLRFFCPPEITVIELVGVGEAPGG